MSGPLKLPDTPRPAGSRESQEAAEEYALWPEEPSPPVERGLPDSTVETVPPANPEDRQFSLRELLALVTVMSVMLSVLASAARWFELAKSPARLAAFFATGLGFAAMFTMIMLAFWPGARRIVLVGWWVVLGAYIVAAVAATLMPG